MSSAHFKWSLAPVCGQENQINTISMCNSREPNKVSEVDVLKR